MTWKKKEPPGDGRQLLGEIDNHALNGSDNNEFPLRSQLPPGIDPQAHRIILVHWFGIGPEASVDDVAWWAA